MASENLPSSIEQCISDIAECPICNEALQDNRCLPCLHMFCLKCLDSYRKGKPKGKPLPCPICRREVSFPKSTADLPRNFFIDKLLDAHKIKKQDILPKTCEICMEDMGDVPKLRSTIGHAREHNSINPCDVPKLRSTIGHARERNSITLASRYCCECHQYICLACERQHKKIKAIAWHKIIDSTSVNDSQDLAPMSIYCLTHKTKEAELYCQDCKMVICWQCKALSHHNHACLDVSSATKDLAAKLEEHIEQISGHLHTKQGHIQKLTECQKLYTDKIEVESAKISREQRRLCRDITDNGDQLKKALTSSTSVHLNAFSAFRRKFESDVAELNKHKIYVEQLIHLGNVSDLCEYTNTLMLKTARLAEEHTGRLIVPPLLHLSDADLQDLLTGRRTDIAHQYSDRLMGNEDKRKDNTNELQVKPLPTGQLAGRHADPSKLMRRSLTRTRSHPALGLSLLFAASETKPNTLKKSKDEDLSKHEDWSLMKIITPEKACTVCGITVLDSMLYVVSQDNNNISVYSATELMFVKNLAVDRLVNPNDIVSCTFNNCLYICDWGTIQCIFRVKVREEMGQINWSTGEDVGCLSVTSEHTVLMAGYLSHKLKEYMSNGELIRSIDLIEGVKPWHAIRLVGNNTQYLICEGDSSSAFHRVCHIDIGGRVSNSYGGAKGFSEELLCGPYHLAVDKNGCILVNDCNNSRILLLNPDLKFIKEFVPSSANVLRRARRMHLDEVAGRLYVADNARSGSETKTGRILVFSNNLSRPIVDSVV